MGEHPGDSRRAELGPREPRRRRRLRAVFLVGPRRWAAGWAHSKAGRTEAGEAGLGLCCCHAGAGFLSPAQDDRRFHRHRDPSTPTGT